MQKVKIEVKVEKKYVDKFIKNYEQYVKLKALFEKNEITLAQRHDLFHSIDELKTAGVADADIVRITQLVGFVNYQVRLIQGIRLLVNKSNKENK